MASLGILFTQLDKFTNNEATDLATWLRNFERCCVVV